LGVYFSLIVSPVFVSGFTIVRNAIKYDYPIREAIGSILPLCDELIVAIGDSEDDTLALIKSIDSPKIKIVETVWDESLREGGKVLADETNKALNACNPDADWCFYIQGDEVIHEKFHPTLKATMAQWAATPKVEGLVFNYLHFYGSYDFVGDSRKWYRREVRIIRRNQGMYSFRDAQGFQKNGRPPRVKEVDAHVYHYGWVKHPKLQQEKQQSFNKLWHDDDWVDQNVPKVNEFDYSVVDAVRKFDGTHPAIMQERISKINWEFSFDPTERNITTKRKILAKVEKATGWNIGEYQNYKII
jgi:hypothetical protein